MGCMGSKEEDKPAEGGEAKTEEAAKTEEPKEDVQAPQGQKMYVKPQSRKDIKQLASKAKHCNW